MKITYKNDEERDEFAKNYRYTTSTQQLVDIHSFYFNFFDEITEKIFGLIKK